MQTSWFKHEVGVLALTPQHTSQKENASPGCLFRQERRSGRRICIRPGASGASSPASYGSDTFIALPGNWPAKAEARFGVLCKEGEKSRYLSLAER